jgi:plastocyanin
MSSSPLRAALAGLTLAGLATPALAQATIQVNMSGVNFTPKNIVINQGDTVQWNWIQGFHDVKSGVGGVSDGVFDSGFPVVISDPFRVTFDGALLWKFPKPNNIYNYFCTVHLPGMTGTVRVQNTSGSMLAYNGGNPAGSLDWIQGDARIGRSMTFAVDNVLNPSDGPGFAFLFGAVQSAPGFPGGIPLPGFGMGAPGAPGDLLINLVPPDPFLNLGPSLWNGSGNPVSFVLNIPNNPNLVGVSLFFQGATFNPAAVDGIGLTNGLRATFGS